MYLATFSIGVVGGLAALSVAITLFVVLRRRLRREATNSPPSTLYGPEGASPYRPGDTITAQPTVAPTLTPDHSMHQRLYVSLRRVVHVWYPQPYLFSLVFLGSIRPIHVPSPIKPRPVGCGVHEPAGEPWESTYCHILIAELNHAPTMDGRDLPSPLFFLFSPCLFHFIFSAYVQVPGERSALVFPSRSAVSYFMYTREHHHQVYPKVPWRPGSVPRVGSGIYKTRPGS